MVYGSDAEKATSLRAFSGGLLKSSNDGSLPLASTNTQCDIPETDSDKKCFFAGKYYQEYLKRQMFNKQKPSNKVTPHILLVVEGELSMYFPKRENIYILP